MLRLLSWLILSTSLLCLQEPPFVHASAVMRVAVLTFQSGSGPVDSEGLGSGLQSMISTDLTQAKGLELVERARLGDLTAELKLGASGLVDKTTAVRIGKLAGATHLLTGSYVIVGDSMRIDARLFGVADGRVLLGEQIEGKKQTFFELEKLLVNKIAARLGVALGPSERAAMERVHTESLEAFRAYSLGLTLLDRKLYDQAIAALRDAERRDPSFHLATLSIKECERVVAELRGKADAIEAARREALPLEKAADEVARDASIQKALRAAETGPAMQRAAVWTALACLYDDPHFATPDRDRLALRRMADMFWARYFALSPQLFPRIPLWPNCHQGFVSAPPVDPTKFAAWLRKAPADLAEYRHTSSRELDSGVTLDLFAVPVLAARLLRDGAGSVALYEQVIALSTRLKGADSDALRRSLTRSLARQLRENGDYGRSSALFSQLALGEKDPIQLRVMAEEIDKNRQLAEESAPDANSVCLAHSTYVLLSGSPAWLVSGNFSAGSISGASGPAAAAQEDTTFSLCGPLATGPRPDGVRTDELRFDTSRDDDSAVVMVDAAASSELDVGFEVSFQPLASFVGVRRDPPWRALTVEEQKQALASGKRAKLAFMLGVRDVKNPERPMQAYDVQIGPSSVTLVQTTQTWRPGHNTKVQERVLEQRAIDLSGRSSFQVALRTQGDTLALTVAGTPLSFALPAKSRAQGFHGFRFQGPGYVGVKGWSAHQGKSPPL